MKDEKQILKELKQHQDERTRLIKEIKIEANLLDDIHSIGRLQNKLNQLIYNQNKTEILMAVLI